MSKPEVATRGSVMRTSEATKLPSYRWGALTLFVASATIITALVFEHVGGYTACPLCLMQRYAYYVAIPLLIASLVMSSGGYAKAAALLLLFVSVAFLANAGLGIYHAGAEWKFWPGPETCAVAGDLSGGGPGFAKQLQETRLIRCDEAPWRLGGLSFAGWNVVLSIFLAITALKAAFAASNQER